MVPDGWRRGVFEEGIELISGQHVEANLVNDSQDGKPYLTGPADFPEGKIIVTKYTRHATKFCIKGDLLITVKGSGTGKVIESDNEYAISRQLMAVRPISFDSKFAFYNLVASVDRYEGAAAGLIPGITRDDVLHTPILIPPAQEQQKIAQILSTWDKAIEKLEALIAAKQKRKKALMLQLLTGKKQFAGFEGAWTEVRLGDLLEGKKCKGKIVTTNAEFKGLPYIGSTSFEGIFGLYSDSDEAITCTSTDILILWDGENAGKVTTNLTGVVSSTVVRCRLKSNNVNNQFIAYCLLKDNYKIRAIREGSGIPHMPGDFEHWYELQLPTIEEQQKIASVLSAADTEIQTHQKQLSALKQQKKGLMQQLLTGKKRVKVDDHV